MQYDDAVKDYKKDVAFAGWKDTLNLACHKQNKHNFNTVVAELKVNRLKVQIIKKHVLCVQFLEGNKIVDCETFLRSEILDKSLEDKVTDFFSVSFGTGREIYRSLVSNAVKHFTGVY